MLQKHSKARGTAQVMTGAALRIPVERRPGNPRSPCQRQCRGPGWSVHVLRSAPVVSSASILPALLSGPVFPSRPLCISPCLLFRGACSLSILWYFRGRTVDATPCFQFCSSLWCLGPSATSRRPSGLMLTSFLEPLSQASCLAL